MAQTPEHAPYAIIEGCECFVIPAHALERASHLICIGWWRALGLDAAAQAADKMRAWIKQTVVQPQKSAASAYRLYKGHATAMDELCIVKVVGTRRVMELNVTGKVVLCFLVKHKAKMSKKRCLK